MTKIRLAIAIVSARGYAERRARCRRLWTHELAGRPQAMFRFFVGDGDGAFCQDTEPDAVVLECPDDYPHLPQKTKCLLDWFMARYDFDYLFKCDDDTFVRADRLLAYAPPHDYCGWSVSRSFPGSPDVASGGAGYLLSRRAAEAASAALSGKSTGAEDDLLGRGLAAAGIALHHDARFRWNADPASVPTPTNDVITAHWVNNAQSEEVVRRPWAVAPNASASSSDLVLRIGSRVIRWVIGPAHDRAFTERVLLPWALPEATRLPADARADFTVGVYLGSAHEVERVMASPGPRFLLLGEPECRHGGAEGCFQFAQQPQASDGEWARYAPMLGIWTPPLDAPPKTRPCSVIEGRGRQWRMDRFEELRKTVGDIDAYGPAYNRPLGGYHCVGPDARVFSKYEGLCDYAFSGAIERLAAEDYVTEKFTDPILCEAVPIYSGCPNIDDYAVPGSYLPFDEAASVDWRNWRAEYARRRPAVLRQK
jgi:hypothetical protein